MHARKRKGGGDAGFDKVKKSSMPQLSEIILDGAFVIFMHLSFYKNVFKSQKPMVNN